MTKIESDIDIYLKDGKIRLFPSKRKKKYLVLSYLITKFDDNKDYTEIEINKIINSNHSFNDPLLLRRELIDWGLLKRTPDGKRYWKINEKFHSLIV